ncbi:MAG TPA: enoyl-CoA hydratase-related protein [Usitatibacter sp.]|nr:enoyl-CoA hydratase-related protein [Usitatibacter sp.]
MTPDIVVTRREAVAAIGFNRPQRRNALTAEMYEAMAAAIAEADADAAVRAVLFHGTEEAFTAGNDIEDFVRRPPAGEDAPVFRLLRSVVAARKPMIAAVNGMAVGLGTTLLLHCDLVYAGEDARFSLPFTKLGLVPEFGSSYLLPLIAGYQRAAELLLLGEPFDAAHAHAVGIVTRIVPRAQVLETAWDAARRLAALPADSVNATRELMKAPHREAVERQMRLEGGHFRALLGAPAAREALAAFLEKRKPDFNRL